MHRCATLITLGLICLVAGRAQAEEAKHIVDDEHRFRIEHPGAGWRLLAENEARKVVPDSVAGAVGPRGTYGVVIVERWASTDAQAFATVLINNMPLVNKRVLATSEVRFAQQDAVRFEVTGSVNEIEVLFINHVFIRDGFAFQVLAWGLPASRPRSVIKAFFKAFSALPGRVRGRARSVTSPDAKGPGWRLAAGVFESAPYRLRVDPSPAWGLVVGDELTKLDAEAEVGFVFGAADAYGVLVAEQARGVDQPAFAKHVVHLWADGVEVKPRGKPIMYSVAGHQLRMERFLVTSNGRYEFLRGAFFDGPTCYQLQFWYEESLASQVLPALQGVLATIQVLAPTAARQLAARMAGVVDPENVVGSDFCLRRGAYRNFALGLQLSKPKAGFWRFEAGDDAKTSDPGALVSFVDPTSGIRGFLAAEALPAGGAAAYHRSVLADLVGEGEEVLGKPPAKTQISGVPALTSLLFRADDDVVYTIRVTTAARGNQAFRLFGSDRAGGDSDVTSAAAWAALLAGIDFDANVPAFAVEDGQIQDQRFGYRLKVGAERGRGRDITPKSIASVASIRTWAGEGFDVVAFAICALQAGQDMKWFAGVVEEIMRDKMSAPEGTTLGIPAKLGGLDAQTLSWMSKSEQCHAWYVARDRSFYAISVVGPRNAGKAWFEFVRSSFAFFD